MNNLIKNKFFLSIGLNQINFTALNENKKILLEKKLLTNDLTLDQNFENLEKFLHKNIFDLEKKLNNYIKEVDLIINYDDFLSIDVSTIDNLNNSINQSINISNLLVNIKDNVINNMQGYDLVHMVINKFIIDGKDYSSIPNENDYDNILLEIKFVCLNNSIQRSLKKIFSKYEILIKNISCYEYVNHFNNSGTDNIFNLSDKLKNGLNPKEILLINKSPKNLGFFEKFFNSFS